MKGGAILRVADLIKMLDDLNDPDAKILINDKAAGYREVDEIEEIHPGRFVIKTAKPKN